MYFQIQKIWLKFLPEMVVAGFAKKVKMLDFPAVKL